MEPKVLLHGAGAIGTVYIYLLQNAGCDVTAVCRSNYEAVKRNGFTLNSGKYGKGIKLRPRVVRTPEEGGDIFDYVLVSSKALPDSKTAQTIKPAITPGKTCIVLIQNGIGIEEEHKIQFPDNPIISCIAYLPTTQVHPGQVEMGDIERLEVGTFPADAYEKDRAARSACDTLVKTLEQGGSSVHFHKDIQEKRWNKLLLNASWNPICALTLSRDVAFLSSSSLAEKMIEDVMLEVVKISQALGYRSINANSARKQIERARSRVGGSGIEPSMLVDVLNGRRMEVDAILGRPVEIAQSLAVSVPHMELLYTLTKALDEAIMLREPGKSLDGVRMRAAAL